MFWALNERNSASLPAEAAPEPFALGTTGRGALRESAGEAPESGARELAGGRDTVRVREMFAQNFDFIWRSLRRLGVRPSAVDDAAQQVFWVAARRMDEIPEGRERAFLFGTVLRIASDARRARARSREVCDERALDAQPSPEPDPEALVDAKRARELLDEVLDMMPIGLRTVFVLFEIEGLAMTEIARLLVVPEGTIASRLRRARKEFHAVAKRVRARGRLRGGTP
jgi:RNA polymerase sigma-70 factor (ECF subfamily)